MEVSYGNSSTFNRNWRGTWIYNTPFHGTWRRLMSTHCLIAKELENKSVVAIYCHHDGYVQGGVGEMLFCHYQDQEKIDKLFSLGAISGLGRIPVSIAEDPENGCDDYARTEGMEPQNLPIWYENVKEFLDREIRISYLYLWKPSNEIAGSGTWYVAGYNCDWEFQELRNFIR